MNTTGTITPLLETKAVAELLGVSSRTVERLSRDGVIPRYRLGPRLIRYRLRDVEAALSRLRVGRG